MTAIYYVGDAVATMNRLPESSVDLVLTSPPFLALRSYLPDDHPDKALEGGAQATPGEYIDWLIDVVEACDRVLASHGTLAIELGDTYAGSGGSGGDYNKGGLREGQAVWSGSAAKRAKNGNDLAHARKDRFASSDRNPGWPLAKSQTLVPELLRFALVYGLNPLTGRQTSRWRLRNTVTWCRPNPTVGALSDKFRPATSDLMVFCKSKRRYFDLDAVREPSDYHRDSLYVNKATPPGQRPNTSQHTVNAAGAPPLDWWSISPGGFPGAHYAVWPADLLVKPIAAMSPERVCRECGEPSRRIVATTPTGQNLAKPGGPTPGKQRGAVISTLIPKASSSVTVGWSDCGHGDWRPGLVLDPFAGTGTTLAVATGHGRDAIGIDLDERNYELALQRVGPLVLTRGEVAA